MRGEELKILSASLLTLRLQNTSISLLYRNVSTYAKLRNVIPLRFSAALLTLRSPYSSRSEGEKEIRGEELNPFCVSARSASS